MIFGSMTVSILGCGWYGFELAKSLHKKGLTVKGSTTTADKLPVINAESIKPYLINLAADKEIIDPEFFDCDVLWISIPPKARAGNGAEYLLKIERLIEIIKTYKIKQVVLISSTGVYGDLNSEVTELNTPKPDSESGKVLLRAEELLQQQPLFTTTVIRFAGLIGPGRDPGRFFAGKINIPNGNSPVNLIHLTDCIGISEAILTKEAFGYTYNACAPQHPSRSEFYTNAAKLSGLESPRFINKKKNWKIVKSIRISEVLNYQFKVDLSTLMSS